MSTYQERTVWQVLEEAAAEPEKELLVLPDARYTYREIRDAAVALSSSLLRLGVGSGDVVALWLPNGVEWVVSFFAAARIGAVTFGINTRLRADEIRFLLGHSLAKLLVVSHRPGGVDFIQLAYELLPELRAGEVPLRSADFPALQYVVTTGREPQPGMLSWPALSAPGTAVLDSPTPPNPTDLALIQYTSGSTGQPKGAMLRHGAIVRAGFEAGERMGLGPEDRFFAPNPFCHVAGTITALLNVVSHRATLVTMARYEAGDALALLERERCTARTGLDAMYQRELLHPDFPRRDLSALRKGVFMGAAEIMLRAYHEMGMTDILSIYAMSETSAAIATPSRTDPIEIRATTVGRPIPGIEVRIVDPATGMLAATGQIGEIQVRGWNVMAGYFRDPEATAVAIDAEGWLHTGDLGRFDEGGNLVFAGRLKDVVRVGGENVSAAEVESFLLRHPAVKLVQVVAMPDADLGEVPIAFVELGEGERCTEAELAAFCHGRLARFKAPRAFVFVTEWPMTGSGKIQKAALRERAAMMARRAQQPLGSG